MLTLWPDSFGGFAESPVQVVPSTGPSYSTLLSGTSRSTPDWYEPPAAIPSSISMGQAGWTQAANAQLAATGQTRIILGSDSPTRPIGAFKLNAMPATATPAAASSPSSRVDWGNTISNLLTKAADTGTTIYQAKLSADARAEEASRNAKIAIAQARAAAIASPPTAIGNAMRGVQEAASNAGAKVQGLFGVTKGEQHQQMVRTMAIAAIVIVGGIVIYRAVGGSRQMAYA